MDIIWDETKIEAANYSVWVAIKIQNEIQGNFIAHFYKLYEIKHISDTKTGSQFGECLLKNFLCSVSREIFWTDIMSIEKRQFNKYCEQ